MPGLHWDLFCRVIDNHGDLGVCWRLAAQLGARGDAVRLWVDQPAALEWMAPQGAPGVSVRPWAPGAADGVVPGDAVVEAFGCELDPGFIAAIARAARERGRQPAWINLEYLSAEPWVERFHGLPSPVQQGPGAGLVKRFFYPGFRPATGGLLREEGLADRRAAFDAPAWQAAWGVTPAEGALRISLLCYEPAGLPALLAQRGTSPRPFCLLATAGRASAALRAAIASQNGPQGASTLPEQLSISYLPYLPQTEYDHLLWACDLNFVRGEDSLVRALWAGRPFVWQPYPQHDGAHAGKLEALLDWMAAPADLRAFSRGWSGLAPPSPLPASLAAWAAACEAARARLSAQDDLASQLGRMAATWQG